MKIIELDEVSSTNDYCKTLTENSVVFARRQSCGKGTKGRSFSSGEGGFYVSIVNFYKDFKSENAFKIMVNSCVAVCKTVEYFNLKPEIRWANDVLVKGKKICGTLIENTFNKNIISRSIVGIGINVNNELPTELSDIATSLSCELNSKINLQTVKKVFLKNINKNFSVNDYKNYIGWFNSTVTLKTANGEEKAVAKDVDMSGNLICEIDGNIKIVSAAEVSLRTDD